MIIQATAFAFGVVGLKAVFDFHNHNNINNMYSLHSWIGITAFVLFSCQVYDYVQSEYFSVKKQCIFSAFITFSACLWIFGLPVS
jgi:cytochrome b-561